MRLKNKVIYITGACGLIGKSFVQAALEQGAKVICADINQAALDSIFQDFSPKFSENIVTTLVDITEKESIQNSLKESLSSFSQVDVLVNNAYPRNKNYGRHFFDVEYSDFCTNIGMNLGGYFLTSQVFSKYFIENKVKGAIVNIASIYGVIPPRFEVYDDTPMTMPVEYAAIKSGLIHLSKYMAKLFQGQSIRVNCLSPGGVFDNQNSTFVNQYNKFCSSKGMILPEDLKGAFVYLCSGESSFVNGQNIIVDDGFTL